MQQNKPKIVNVPLASIDKLASQISALDFMQSENADRIAYKKLCIDMHNTVAEMLGLHASLVYGDEEPIASYNIDAINALAKATLQ